MPTVVALKFLKKIKKNCHLLNPRIESLLCLLYGNLTRMSKNAIWALGLPTEVQPGIPYMVLYSTQKNF